MLGCDFSTGEYGTRISTDCGQNASHPAGSHTEALRVTVVRTTTARVLKYNTSTRLNLERNSSSALAVSGSDRVLRVTQNMGGSFIHTGCVRSARAMLGVTGVVLTQCTARPVCRSLRRERRVQGDAGCVKHCALETEQHGVNLHVASE